MKEKIIPILYNLFWKTEERDHILIYSMWSKWPYNQEKEKDITRQKKTTDQHLSCIQMPTLLAKYYQVKSNTYRNNYTPTPWSIYFRYARQFQQQKSIDALHQQTINLLKCNTIEMYFNCCRKNVLQNLMSRKWEQKEISST